jgi:hypothetical protein
MWDGDVPRAAADLQQQFPPPVQAPEQHPRAQTAVGDMEIIRRMASCYGNDVIARVLNLLGRKTGRSNRRTVLLARVA